MKLNRGVIKDQAQQIIKGNVLKLFFITLIIGVLTGSAGFSAGFNSGSDDVNVNYNGDIPSVSDSADGDFNADFFENFGEGDIAVAPKQNSVGSFVSGFVGGLSSLLSVFSIVLAPLTVMLAGLFWQLIKGNNMDFGNGLTYIFKKTFDKNYLNKFLYKLVCGILLALLFCCFIVPGVIFYYKWRFADYILAEKPELTFKEAMDLSKKMTNNHKGELFVLDLSFIPWILLTCITVGIASIYVAPYYQTVYALYYENFKLRALSDGTITEADYMSQAEKNAQAFEANQQAAPQTYYQPVQNEAPAAANNVYYTPAVPVAPVAPVAETPAQPTTYYQPAQPGVPQQNTYQTVPPVAPAAPAPAEPVAPAIDEAPAAPEVTQAPAAPEMPAEPVAAEEPVAASEPVAAEEPPIPEA